MIGMVDSPHELYIGHGAEKVAKPRLDASETACVAWIPLAEISGLMERDELLGVGTLVALLHTLAFTKATGH
jgi:8-oxo-dGDP phosphatase